MPISDTSPTAQALHFELYRSMTGEQRLLLAYEMSISARLLTRARLLHEHPLWTEAEIARELLRLAFFPQPLPAGFQ